MNNVNTNLHGLDSFSVFGPLYEGLIEKWGDRNDGSRLAEVLVKMQKEWK